MEQTYTQEEMEDFFAQQEAEIRAERMNDWIMGGGAPEDASTYAFYEEHGWPELIEDEGTCEHGLSASLCAGPNHYPMDWED